MERCLLLAGLPQPRLVMQVVALKKSREGMEERWQVLGLNVQLIPVLIYISSQVIVCYLLLSS